MSYQWNPEIIRDNKSLNFIKNIAEDLPRKKKAENFIQQVKPYYICTICYGSLYWCSVRLFKPKKYHILISCGIQWNMPKNRNMS